MPQALAQVAQMTLVNGVVEGISGPPPNIARGLGVSLWRLLRVVRVCGKLGKPPSCELKSHTIGTHAFRVTPLLDTRCWEHSPNPAAACHVGPTL